MKETTIDAEILDFENKKVCQSSQPKTLSKWLAVNGMMNQIFTFRKWLEMTISIHFILVVWGSRNRSNLGGDILTTQLFGRSSGTKVLGLPFWPVRTSIQNFLHAKVCWEFFFDGNFFCYYSLMGIGGELEFAWFSLISDDPRLFFQLYSYFL